MTSAYHEAGRPVNDGEVEVLRRLRDELPESWYVVGNFEFPSAGGRWYECDAIALSPRGYGFLIETKSWTGRISGSDSGWVLPSLDGSGHSLRPAPIHLLTSKTKKLVSWLRSEVVEFDGFVLFPLVVLVSETLPELSGKSASTTIRHVDLVSFMMNDPRTPDQLASASRAGDGAGPIHAKLIEGTRKPTTKLIGQFELDELEELREDGTEIWRCHPASSPDTPCRLKRYRIDTLAPRDRVSDQLKLARQDSAVLLELAGDDVVPPWGPPIEDESDFVLVSRIPRGQSVQQLLAAGELPSDVAIECVKEMFRVLGRIHLAGVIHRNVRPSSVWLETPAFRVRFWDFDFARVGTRAGVTVLLDPSIADPDYAAPEVLRDLGQATERSDVYSLAKICKELLAACVHAAAVPASVTEVLERCLAEDPVDRPRDASEAARSLDGAAEQVGLFEEQDVLIDRFLVRSRHEAGGLTVVYRLYDNVTHRDYSGKFVRPEYAHLLDAREEYQLLSAISEHPNVARPTFVLTMDRVKRGDQVLTHHDEFLLTDWIEGESLDRYIEEGLPLRRILEIGVDMLRGLAHLHENHIIHRDIKPENVMVNDDHRAILLDFNVSAREAPGLRTSLGTRGYTPAEVSSGGEWSTSADVHATGVCLIELVAGKRLGTSARSWLDQNAGELPQTLMDLLGQLVSLNPTDRGSAGDVAKSLSALAAELVTVLPRPPAPPDVPPSGIGNPYVGKLMSLFSQSSVSNAGTRGLNDFARWLHVETEIDRDLKARILSGEPSLVIITGNAGDGKTAFIRGIETVLGSMDDAAVTRSNGGNGSSIRASGHTWVTNWDGSQDEGGVGNDEVLEGFLGAFAGPTLEATPAKTAVIAINEGRLVDFLRSRRGDFGALESVVEAVFNGDRATVPDWLVLVNLNKRVLTADGFGNVVQHLLHKMSDDSLWTSCTPCPAFDACPSRSNASLLRDPTLGPRTMERIRETLDLVRLRRRLHITTRDLLSVLSYVLVGNLSCEEIIALAEADDAKALTVGHAYNRLFAGRDDPLSEGASKDRLLAEIAALDVAETSQPELDGRLWLLGLEALRPDPEGLLRSDRRQLATLITSELLSERLQSHAYLRRKVFLEREDPGYLEMLPYDHLRQFLQALEGADEGLAEGIARAVTASEGLRDAGMSVVAVRLIDDLDARDRSYVTRNADTFCAEVVDDRASAQYVEYRSDLVRFSSRSDPSLALDIDVDVFEALMKMLGGFTPSREDLRGSWLSLATFKERLASRPSRELLLQSASGVLTLIAVDVEGSIRAEVLV